MSNTNSTRRNGMDVLVPCLMDITILAPRTQSTSILLTVLSDPEKYINMLIPGRKCHPYKIYISAAMMSALGGIVDSMLFVHAATGCKTSSAGYLKGKRLPFRKLHAQRNTIAAASEAFLCFVYGGKIDDHLDVKIYQL